MGLRVSRNAIVSMHKIAVV